MFTVRFGSVFIKKSNQTEFFFLKKTETGSNRPVLVRFGFLEKKPVQTGLARFTRFFPIWLGLTRFWLGFFPVRFGSVFPVPGLKNRNRTGRFFQNFNQFFFTVRFFRLFFFRFSRFNRFFGFFEHPYKNPSTLKFLYFALPHAQ